MKTFIFVCIGYIVAFSIPNLYAATYGGGSGTAADPYQIWDPNQMNLIGTEPSDWGKCFVLMADIDMSGIMYNIIGNFTGTFNGNGYVISNLTYTTTANNYAGLFGNISGAIITNLGVENVNIYAVGRYAGSIVGYQYSGIITNCYATGSVTSKASSNFSYAGGIVGFQEIYGLIRNCRSSCLVKADASGSMSYAGGIAGMSYHEISNCYNEGAIDANSSSGVWSYGSVAGGIVGSFDSVVKNCYNTGSVNARSSTISNTYEGGITGFAMNVQKCQHCFWNTETSGTSYGVAEDGLGGHDPNGAIGKTTAEMKMLSTYISNGWDFGGEGINGTADIWRMCADGVSYPQLQWEFSGGGDFICPDGVRFEDFTILAKAWLSMNGGANWNPVCDIAVPSDSQINTLDLTVFAQHWLDGM